MNLFSPKDRVARPEELERLEAERSPSWGESLGANVSGAWDWFSLGRPLDALREQYAEMQAYGDRDADGDGVRTWMDTAINAEHAALTEEQWKESEFFRDGIEFDGGMNPVRAKILAEDYDKRRKRDELLSRQTLAQKVVGFGVQMGVGFLDPVNYIPFVGQAAKLRMIGRFGTVGGRVLAGGLDAAVGNALTSPIIGEDLKRRGEKITFEDYAVDTLMGAGVGMLFGGAGGAWAKLRGEKRADVLNALALAADDVAEGRPVDVSPLLKGVVESGELTHERAMKRLADQGLRVEEAGALLGPLERMAEDSGMELDAWMRRHISDITVGGKADEGAIRFQVDSPEARYVRFAKKVIYDNDRRLKVEFEDTGTDLSLESREAMKAYFDTLKPQKIKALKYSDPDKYLFALHEIAEHLFPDGISFRMTQDGKDVDASHFLKQEKRRLYVHSLSDTLDNPDVKFIFQKEGTTRDILLKRYFDKELKKDVWDTVVTFGSVVQSKFPTRGGKGKREWARVVEMDLNWAEAGASQSANPGGNTRNALTRQGHDTNVNIKEAKSKRFGGDFSTVRALQSKARNALPLEIVETFDDLPEHIRAKAGERGMEGVRGVSDGTAVYLVADAFDSPEEAVKVWLHEQVGHVGLRGLLGDGVDDVLDRVFEHFGPERMEGIRENYGLDFANPAHRREAAEEMLAHMAERMNEGVELSEADRNLWESFKRWLLDALRDMGVDVEMSDDELRYLIQDAARWTMDGTVRKERGGHSVRYRAGGSNGAVEFLPDGRAHIRIFDGADLQEAGAALSRILSERFQHAPPATRPDWRTERPESPEFDPMESVDPDASHEEMALLHEQRVQAMMEAGELTEQELAALDAADIGVQRAERWGAGYEAAVDCIIKRGL
ncbi:hypothetical protein [Salidesulfovibrio brasiliensis]|uniref:hypothetical protein n=1 Tax=Salidesulfovibrio brasiliensis TaxID=221711 RepID=UPI0006D1BE82|nr:hypothetical protein [Salidesulfovibrio brasiliensis]